MKKRAIAFLMAFAMVMSLLPGTAGWAGEVEDVSGDAPSTGDNQENTDIASLGINGLEDGKTYGCEGVTFSVAENVKVTIGDEEMSPGEDGNYTIKKAGNYAIKISDGENTEKTINVIVAAHEWDPEKKKYNWTDDHKGATVELTCKKDSNHKESHGLNITETEEKASTCTEKGKTIYIGTATIDGVEYEDSKVIENEINPSNHVGGTEVRDAREASCEEDGYTGDTYCKGCGEKIGEGETISAIGHKWDMENIMYKWAEDGSKADVIIQCKHDSTHTETYNMEIKSEEKVPATCTEKGTTTYTGTVEIRGKKYTISKDIEDREVNAGNHEWDMENVVYKWAENGSKAEVIIPCKHDSTHQVSHNMEIESKVTTPATCIKKGITTYTGTATINDVVYTDSKEIENIEIDPSNHEGETIIKNEKKETCVEKGYTGDVFCKDCDAKISEGKEIKAIGHAMGNGVVTKEPAEKSEGVLTYTCKNGCGYKKTSSFSKEVVTVELGKKVELFSDTSACKIKNFNASKYKKYFEIDKKTGMIKTKKYYKVKIQKEIPVKVVVNGKPYTVKIKIKIPAPKVKIKKKKDTLNGEAAYRYTFTYKEKKAKRIQVRIKNLKEANSVLDQYVSKNKSNKDSYIKIKQKRVKKLGKKITFEIIAYYGKNKSERLTIKR